MPFRPLSSIEFQGYCSRDLNLVQSENCIFGIYDQHSFCRSLILTSLELSEDVKSRFFQLSNRKNVKVNIMRFRILCSIEFQGPLLQKHEIITVWKLHCWNLRSMGFLTILHPCITRQSLDIKTSFFSSVIENNVKVNIMPFRPLSSIEFQGYCSRDLNLGQSENCIFEIYDQYSFCRCLTRTSLEIVRWGKKQVYPAV
jgi:hypothetical protein